MRQSIFRFTPLVGLAAVFLYSGCGELPHIPTLDQLQTVPDSSQVTILTQTQFTPKEGPLGTLITVHGRGTIFPAGIVHVQFSGTGSIEFDLDEPTSELKFRVPLGAISGPFGFTIGGRRSIALENSLPTSNVFQAWRFQEPGFLVIPPENNGIPSDWIRPPPNTQELPNAGGH